MSWLQATYGSQQASTFLQARAGGDFSQTFNEQKRRTLQRALEHLLLFTPEADLPAAFQRAKPRRQGAASAGDAPGPGAVLQPTVTLRCACQHSHPSDSMAGHSLLITAAWKAEMPCTFQQAKPRQQGANLVRREGMQHMVSHRRKSRVACSGDHKVCWPWKRSRRVSLRPALLTYALSGTDNLRAYRRLLRHSYLTQHYSMLPGSDLARACRWRQARDAGPARG